MDIGRNLLPRQMRHSRFGFDGRVKNTEYPWKYRKENGDIQRGFCGKMAIFDKGEIKKCGTYDERMIQKGI